MSTQISRRPKGSPTGGQFATTARASSSLSLSDSDWQWKMDGLENRVATTDAAIDALASSGRGREYLDSMSRLYPYLDAEEFDFDLYAPASKALADGRDDHAQQFLETAYELNGREQRWRDNDYQPPGIDELGPVRIGYHYHPDNTPAQIAARVGMDIEEATDAGYLPEGVAYRVGTATGADGTPQVTIRAEGLPDDLALTVVDDPLEERAVFAPSSYALKIGSRLSRIGNAYTRRHAVHGEVSVFIDADVIPAGDNADAALSGHLQQVGAGGTAGELAEAERALTQAREHKERIRSQIMARHGF